MILDKKELILKNLIFILMTLLFVVSCQSPSNKTIQAVFIVGQVEKILPGQNPVAIQFSDILPENTMIQTGMNSICYLKIGNLGLVKIREKTQIVLEKLIEGLELSISKGSVLNKVLPLKPGNHYAVKTPLIAIGVRGTVFGVESIENETKIGLIEGKLAINGLNDFTMEKGQNELFMEAVSSFHFKESSPKKISSESIEISQADQIELEGLRSIILLENEELEKLAEKIRIQEEEIRLKLESLKNQQSVNQLKKDEKILEEQKKQVQKVQNSRKQEMTLDQIKKNYKILNEFKLFNGQKIIGGIVKSDEKSILVQTEKGQILLNRKQIDKMKVIQ